MSSINEQFTESMLELSQEPIDFVPDAYYNKAGDCIEFLAKPDPFYCERINDQVTVYYSQISKDVIGAQIKDIKKLKAEILSKMPGFAIEIRDGKVKLSMLFLASLWSADWQDNETCYVQVYEKLRQYAEENNAEAEFCLA